MGMLNDIHFKHWLQSVTEDRLSLYNSLQRTRRNYRWSSLVEGCADGKPNNDSSCHLIATLYVMISWRGHDNSDWNSDREAVIQAIQNHVLNHIPLTIQLLKDTFEKVSNIHPDWKATLSPKDLSSSRTSRLLRNYAFFYDIVKTNSSSKGGWHYLPLQDLTVAEYSYMTVNWQQSFQPKLVMYFLENLKWAASEHKGIVWMELLRPRLARHLGVNDDEDLGMILSWLDMFAFHEGWFRDALRFEIGQSDPSTDMCLKLMEGRDPLDSPSICDDELTKHEDHACASFCKGLSRIREKEDTIIKLFEDSVLRERNHSIKSLPVCGYDGDGINSECWSMIRNENGICYSSLSGSFH